MCLKKIWVWIDNDGGEHSTSVKDDGIDTSRRVS